MLLYSIVYNIVLLIKKGVEMDTISIKLEKEIKDTYKKICKEKDSTTSQEVRKLIKREIEKYFKELAEKEGKRS